MVVHILELRRRNFNAILPVASPCHAHNDKVFGLRGDLSSRFEVLPAAIASAYFCREKLQIGHHQCVNGRDGSSWFRICAAGESAGNGRNLTQCFLFVSRSFSPFCRCGRLLTAGGGHSNVGQGS